MAQPKEAFEAKTKIITIDSHYNVADQNVKISAGDSIQFKSQANQDCSASFTPSGVFSDQDVPANDSAPAQTTSSNQTAITIDYVVDEPSGGTTGPYSVTIDDGALPVTVDSYGDSDLNDVAIPNNGSLFFTYNEDGPNPPASITVEFTNPNGQDGLFLNGQQVSSQTLNSGDNPTLEGRGNCQVGFSFSGTTPKIAEGTGGGTIKVGSG
jgi:hypothetical protein